ncbi:MAG: anti-sigma factor [Mycobacteriales bacterium]
MKQNDHEEFDAFAVGWALHALEPAEEEAFAAHLATCDRCQRMVQDSEAVLGDLAYDVPMADPPPIVLERIREATGARDDTRGGALRVDHRDRLPQSLAPIVPLARAKARRRPAWAMAAVAAGLVIVALLGWNVVLQSRVDTARQQAAQRESLINQLGRSSTRAVLTDATNHTVGYVLQRGSSIDIVAGGMAPNDRSRSTYVLWAVQGSGDPPQAVGTFDVDKTGMDVQTVRGAAPAPGTFTGFAVSMESGRQIPPRPSPPIATGAVLS